jgi:hypothetical protein
VTLSHRIRFLAAAAALAVAAGCGGGSSTATVTQTVTTPGGGTSVQTTTVDETPGDFYEQLLGYDFVGQWGRSWDLLHPGQQALVTREAFTDCQDQRAGILSQYEFDGIDVNQTYEDPLDVTGVPEKTSTAVTYTVKYHQGSQHHTERSTSHAVLHDGEWRWVLSNADVKAYQDGTCPS